MNKENVICSYLESNIKNANHGIFGNSSKYPLSTNYRIPSFSIKATALAVLTVFSSASYSASYIVANEYELRQAIISSNTNGDASSTIILSSNISLSSSDAFESINKPLIIDTGEFSLSTGDAGQSSIGTIWSGAPLYFHGNIVGTDITETAQSTPGPTAITITNSSYIENNANVTGAQGGNRYYQNNRKSGAGGNGFTVTGGEFLNNGNITGGHGGWMNANGQSNANGGVAAGPGGIGLFLTNGNLDNKGTIKGGDGGSITNFSAGADNQYADAGGAGAFLVRNTHTNTGTITGGDGGQGKNYGSTPHGNGGAGVILQGAGILNSGTITGGNGISNGGVGVSVRGSGEIVNFGIIKGGVGGASGYAVSGRDIKILNDGSLIPGAAGNFAINFEAGVNILELHAGSDIQGNVRALSGGSDSLILAGQDNQTFNSSEIGSKYLNFAKYEKNGTSTWTLTGSNNRNTPWTLSNGVLSISSFNSLGNQSAALNFNGGTLQITGEVSVASNKIINISQNGGTIDVVDSAEEASLTNTISGDGHLTKIGAGTLILSANNLYTGGTAINEGKLQIGNNTGSGSIIGNIVNNGVLSVDRFDVSTLDNMISGTGSVVNDGTGTTILARDNSYKGVTNVNSGGLLINGDQTSATGDTFVRTSAMIGGNGFIGGNVVLDDGATLSPGDLNSSPGTLTIRGSLSLSAQSELNYDFGKANVIGEELNDLTIVKGDLILGGNININATSGGEFNPGLYRIISYNGALTDNGLNIGAVPLGSKLSVQTSIENQVNLVNSTGVNLNFWDGLSGPKNNSTVNGGDGTWSLSERNDNWTDINGSINGPYDQDSFAIFSGKSGVVTLDNSLGEVGVSGMQFSTDGYKLQDGSINLTGSDAVIRVGDGSRLSKDYIATIESILRGTANLNKTDSGTLVLSGKNINTGKTNVLEGTLRAGAKDAFSEYSSIDINPGAALDLDGFNQTISGLTNSGFINLHGSTPGTILKVTGAYNGNNGIIGVSTVLGSDDSVTDKLLFSGDEAIVSGNTSIQITNAGGLGEKTTGDGIVIVATENGATLNPGSFTLEGEHIDAGAYEYRLFQTADVAALKSVSYRPEVALIAALSAQLSQSDMTMLGDMSKRMGDEDTQVRIGSDQGDKRRIWGRMLRTNPSIDQKGTGASLSTGRMTGFQAGLDLYAKNNIKAGLYVGQLEGDTSTKSFAPSIEGKSLGFNSLHSRYLGMYGTWFNDSGFYADAVLQNAEYKNTLHLTGSSAWATTKGSGWLTSLEIGKSFSPSSNLVIEPQAQVIYRKINLDDTSISFATVQNRPSDEWTMRVGARIKGNFSTSAGKLTPYGRINIYKSQNTTDVASFINQSATTEIKTDGGYTSTELATGASMQINNNTIIYGEIGKLFSNGGNSHVKSGLQASVGLKVLW